MYTFQTTPYGTIQVSKNGQIVATTTPQQAAIQFGYGQPSPQSRDLPFAIPMSGGYAAAPYAPPQVSAPVAPTAPPTKPQEQSIDDQINKMMELIISSNKVPNPGLTEEDLAAIDPKNFLAQAEASISPYYKSKFQVIKDDLSKTFSNLGYDLGLKKEDINRQTEQSIRSGNEELVDRGLTFSGTRDRFLSDTEDARQRSLTAADVTAQRAGDVAGSTAQAQLGTANMPALSFGGYSYNPNTRYTAPIVGSLPQERQFDIESKAKLLANDEARKRAYAVGALSFG